MRIQKENYIVELDGLTYRVRGNRFTQIANLNDVDSNCILVSDMQEAVSKTSLVESDIKYVDLITRKNLQEAGEFDEPVSVITHWKKKKGKNSTELCYTAVPSRLLLQYQDQINENSHAILMVPLYAVLLDVLKKRRSRKPVAVTFMHNRFVDMIVGTRHRIYYANRCVAFDTSPEQMESLWSAVKSDIESIEKEHRIDITEIVHLDWIDSQPPPEWITGSDMPFHPVAPEPVFVDNETHHISFLKALKSTSGLNSISSFMNKIAFYTGKYTAHLNMLLILAIFACLAWHYTLNHKTGRLQSDITAMERRILDSTKTDTVLVEKKNSKNTLDFIQKLISSRNTPTYKRLINQISSAFSPFAATDIQLNEINIDYLNDSLHIEISGMITAPFDTAYRGFQTAVTSLRRMNYTVDENKFDTQIQTSDFLLKLTKRT